MSDMWAEFHRQIADWRRTGDTERLGLVGRYFKAGKYRETNPGLKFDLLTECRDEARRLREPWWELFFEAECLSTLTADLHDFARALPMAMELMVRLNTPKGRAHSDYAGILTDVLYTYAQIDPLGYRDEIEHGFAFLHGQLGNKAEDGFVLNYRWTDYLLSVERWNEAHESGSRQLALADQKGNTWFSAWYSFLLCRTCHGLDLNEELADHAALMVEHSTNRDQFQRTLADGLIWLAVARQARGDARAAEESFRRGMRVLQPLDRRDEISADAIAAYYNYRGDWMAAAGVRDRQLADLTGSGSLHDISIAHIERCRALANAGQLTADDLEAARQATAKLRQPGWYLAKLDRIPLKESAFGKRA